MTDFGSYFWMILKCAVCSAWGPFPVAVCAFVESSVNQRDFFFGLHEGQP